jgi:3-phosphoshikimate 1-carboxyvinyltransferase
VHFPASSSDASALITCLRQFGAVIEELTDASGSHLKVRGFGAQPQDPGIVNPGNAGAVLRLLMGIGALLPEVEFRTDHEQSLGQRPHEDLLFALEQLGVSSRSNDGRLPIVLRGGNVHGGTVTVSGATSSQFLSSLLFLAPLIGEPVQIRVVDGLVSKPLVQTTLEVMEEAGINVNSSTNLMEFDIPAGQAYRPREYTVNGDYPSAAAVLAAAAATNSTVSVTRLFEDRQGERQVIPLMREMGAVVTYDGREVALEGHPGLKAVSFNGDTATDMVLAMVGLSCLAQGESRFYGIGNMRYKECDRISVPVNELKRIGVDCEEGPSEIIVRGQPQGYEGGQEVGSHHDHRVAQMLTIVGLRCHRGLTVLDAENVEKSYPRFFEDLIDLGARIEVDNSTR